MTEVYKLLLNKHDNNTHSTPGYEYMIQEQV